MNPGLFVSPVCGGAVSVAVGLFKAAVSLKVPMGVYDSSKAFRRLVGGDWSRYKESVEMMRGEILSALDNFQPGWILALDAEPLDAELIKRIRDKSPQTRIAHWFLEDHQEDFVQWWRAVGPLDDVFFSAEGGAFETVARAAGIPYTWLPAACDDEEYAPEPAVARRGVAFVGTVRPERVRLFERIAATGVALSLYGPKWSEQATLRPHVAMDGWVTGEAEAAAYRSALMVANLHDAGKSTALVNPRTFAAARCGALVVMNRRDDLPRIFAGDEVEAVESVEAMAAAIARLVADPVAVRERGQRAARCVGERHTWRHRVQEIVAQLNGAA